MATLVQIRAMIALGAVQAPASPGQAGVLQELAHPSPILGNGTSDGQVNVVARKTYTIAGSGSQSIDLTSVTDAYGTAIAAAEIVAFVFRAASANAGPVRLSPNASNGWLSLVSDATAYVPLPAGGTIGFVADGDGYAVSGTNKVLDIDNPNGSEVTVDVILFGRNA